MGLIKSLLYTPWRIRAALEDRACGGRFPHELAICAIFREEAPFLEEWLTFHSGVGVTHFYLYNNYSTDNFRERAGAVDRCGHGDTARLAARGGAGKRLPALRATSSAIGALDRLHRCR